MDDGYFLRRPDAGEAGGTTLDFDKSPTVLLVFAANRFTRTAARLYQDDFGIGAMDWRMLVMLTKEPDIPVARASKVIGIDKAAVSRSLARLEGKGLVKAAVPAGDERRKTWALTRKGHALHDRILPVALSRQQEILDGFSQQDVERLNGYLQKLLDNVIALDGD